jgi:hypothetical protein
MKRGAGNSRKRDADQPLLRLVCRTHKTVMARVVRTEKGPKYQTRRPVVPGKLFHTAGGGLTRSLAAKDDQRLPEVTENGEWVIVGGDERYVFDRSRRGTLPAWCERCRAERWVTAEEVRHLRGTLVV